MASHTLFADRAVLEKEILELDVPIRLESDIRASLTPLAIGHRTVGNRFAIHPMEGCDGTLDGAPDELTFRRWARFGGGGAKLLWGEAGAVPPRRGAKKPQQLVGGRTLSSPGQHIGPPPQEQRPPTGL